MNKVYRLVWNTVTNTWCCASEHARARGKSSRGVVSRRASRQLVSGLRPWLATISAVFLTLHAAARAAGPAPAPNQLPTGGQVIAGQAAIRQTGTAALNVTQASDRAAINWQTFDVGSAASVNFQQPSAQSVTLNRVLDANPSQIFGRLTANGQVFLTNPNGVYFAPGASVDVGGLVATTHDISDADFMSGKSTFSRNGATGSVTNLGQIKAAPGGYVALLAPEVRNEGVIVAQAGTVALAAGEAITLNFAPTSGLASVTVTPGQIRTLVENRRAIVAEGGQIILSARAADQLLASVVNSGELSASSMVERGGRIVLGGGEITLAETSSIKADGAKGGGEIVIGSAVTPKLDAKGTLSARGGAGAGGSVETSAEQVDFRGLRVDTTGATATGNWLLDPYDLTVDASAATTIGNNLGSSNVTLQTGASSSSGPGVVNTSGVGDITVSSAISWSSTNKLTLDAYRNVNVNASITGGGGMTLKAAGGVIIGGVTLQTNGGDITLWSNSGGATTGGVYVKDSSTLDSRTAADRTAANTSTASGGGTITLGGGSATTTLASGTVVPTGSASSISGGSAAVVLGTDSGLGHNAAVSFYSGGGNIAISGNNTTSVLLGVASGVNFYFGANLDAGSSGNISVTGSSSPAAT
ncbi:MAG TPA: filamentous hemagglutinin N-terminal domain-containing protein, partial [Burkholderiales bacterium]|nr:filamentous hemagglutinin N-terminal domain-containing protein [Burkholderiales bacterium]